MSTAPNLSTKEIAFSIAMSTSVLLTFLRAVEHMATLNNTEDRITQGHKELIATLEQLLDEMIRQSGDERAVTGYEKTKVILDLVMQLSRPSTVQ